MDVQINWATRVVYVPKSELTLVQLNPTEIYNLPLNDFRLALKDQEDSENGICFPDTHLHYSEVTLGGLTFARVIAMINGYTVTFEDGQYAVNLIGANSNVGDVVNVNQVSVRSQNSAGLISTPLIEFASFQGGVTVDVVNGTAGTVFPIGTELAPVSNIPDALLIAAYRGFKNLYIKGNITLGSESIIQNMIIHGQNSILSTITIEPGADITGTTLCHATFQGTLDSNCWLESGVVGDIDYLQGYIRDCTLVGEIVLGGSDPTVISDCVSGIPGTTTPVVNMGGSGRNFALRSFSGGIKITNLTGDNSASLDFISGGAIIDSTVTAGTVIIRGVASIEDNAGPGATVIDVGAVSKELVSEQVWSDTGDGIFIDMIDGMAGTAYPAGSRSAPVKTMADAYAISQLTGHRTFYIKTNALNPISLPSGSGEDWRNKQFKGWSNISQDIFVITGADISGCHFEKFFITGVMIGTGVEFERSLVSNLTNISGECIFKDCGLQNTIGMGADGATLLGQTVSAVSEPVILDFNNKNTVIRLECAGEFCIENLGGSAIGFISLGRGTLTRCASCTGGVLTVQGIGIFTDEGSGGTTENQLVSPVDTALLPTIYDAANTLLLYEGGRWKINALTKQLYFYAADGETIIKTYNLYDENGAPDHERVFERRPV